MANSPSLSRVNRGPSRLRDSYVLGAAMTERDCVAPSRETADAAADLTTTPLVLPEARIAQALLASVRDFFLRCGMTEQAIAEAFMAAAQPTITPVALQAASGNRYWATASDLDLMKLWPQDEVAVVASVPAAPVDTARLLFTGLVVQQALAGATYNGEQVERGRNAGSPDEVWAC